MNHEPKIEIIVGEVISNGQQWIKLCVNGRLTDLILHVDPQHIEHSKRQLEHIASQIYQWGFFDGSKDTKSNIRLALGLDNI